VDVLAVPAGELADPLADRLGPGKVDHPDTIVSDDALDVGRDRRLVELDDVEDAVGQASVLEEPAEDVVRPGDERRGCRARVRSSGAHSRRGQRDSLDGRMGVASTHP